MKTNWKASDLMAAKYIKYLGTLSVETPEGSQDFECLALSDRLLFGGMCNAGFLESGYILMNDSESETEALAELLADLECFYRDGPESVSRIVHNDRM